MVTMTTPDNGFTYITQELWWSYTISCFYYLWVWIKTFAINGFISQNNYVLKRRIIYWTITTVMYVQIYSNLFVPYKLWIGNILIHIYTIKSGSSQFVPRDPVVMMMMLLKFTSKYLCVYILFSNSLNYAKFC